jgi:hypothetical protein
MSSNVNASKSKHDSRRSSPESGVRELESHPQDPASTSSTHTHTTHKKLEQVESNIKEAANNAKGLATRNPWIVVATTLALLGVALYATGHFGDHRTASEKILDQVKAYGSEKYDQAQHLMPQQEKSGWMPWNWKIFQRKPKDLSERVTGNDFETNWANVQKFMSESKKEMETELGKASEDYQSAMKSWWDNWDTSAAHIKDVLANKAGFKDESTWQKIQSSIQSMMSSRNTMEDNLKSTGSKLKGWWENWENKAKNYMKESTLPDALMAGNTEHVHLYEPSAKSKLDVIYIHTHGYEKPAAEEKKGFFSK